MVYLFVAKNPKKSCVPRQPLQPMSGTTDVILSDPVGAMLMRLAGITLRSRGLQWFCPEVLVIHLSGNIESRVNPIDVRSSGLEMHQFRDMIQAVKTMAETASRYDAYLVVYNHPDS